MTQLALLQSRAVLVVSGSDRVSFLQGLVSNDVTQAAPDHAVWAAMLTPQGKWLADFFIFSDGNRLLLDVEAAQAAEIARRLTRFRLRADAEIQPDPLQVYAAWGEAASGGATPDGSAPASALRSVDPRLVQAGSRILGLGLVTNASEEEYDAHRLALGLPSGSRDMEPQKSVLLEAGFDELRGISWTKGCYMGQDLTARTKYRGLIKRRLIPIRALAGELPASGSAVVSGGTEVGQLRSARGELGLALLRLDALRSPLDCGGPVEVQCPAWMRLGVEVEEVAAS